MLYEHVCHGMWWLAYYSGRCDGIEFVGGRLFVEKKTVRKERVKEFVQREWFEGGVDETETRALMQYMDR